MSVYHGATAGIVLTTGFTTKNPVTIASDGIITGNTAGYDGVAVYASGYAWTIANAGTIVASGSKTNGVDLKAGGNVINGAANATGASIAGVYTGIAVYSAPGTITNYGTVQGTGTAFQVGGYISGLGVYVGAGGVITNGASGSSAALIEGYTTAIAVQNTAATIINFGTLRNTTLGDTLYLGAGATGTMIVNQATGLITGRSAIDTTPRTASSGGVVIQNYGTISNTDSTVADIYLGHGGSVTNGATNATGALISGAGKAIEVTGGPGSIVNFGKIDGNTDGAVILNGGGVVNNSGVISGGVGVYVGSDDLGSNTIVNFGTIIGTGGTAISVGTVGTELIVIETGSSLQGVITNVQPGDAIDLPFLSFSANGTATVVSNGTVSQQLQIVENSGTFTIALDPKQNFSGDIFQLGTDSGAGTLISVNTGGPPPELTAGQINTVYSDVLGRTASAAEQTAWVAAESSGPLSASQVIADIVNSPEAQNYSWPVVRLYQAAFGRVPDSQKAFAANVDAVDPASSGTASELQLATDFVASAEFQSRYGNPNTPVTLAPFIQALYLNVLGRTGSTAEISAWLATGDSAAQILIGFSDSPEFQAKANPAVASLLTANALAETIVSGSLFQTAITGAVGGQTVSDGSANLTLLDQYAAAGFATAPDLGHGALVTDTLAQPGETAPTTLLTIPHH